MKCRRYILSLLYLILMILVPYVHLITHSHDQEHHEGDSQPHPCSLCILLQTPAEAAESEISFHIDWVTILVTPLDETPSGTTPQPARCARAPPFMTA